MTKRPFRAALLAAGATALLAGGALAAVNVDETGNGFVGKGDVQLVFGWNNKQLQSNADDVDFRIATTSVTTTDWTCENDGAPPAQERTRTTTTTLQGLVTSVGRENSKGKDGPVTGFILSGFEGDPTSSVDSDGPPLLSCPANPSGFYLVEDSVVVTGPTVTGSGLQVTDGSGDWFDIG